MMHAAAVVGRAIGCGIVSPAGNARESIIARANQLWQQGIARGAVRPTPQSNGTTLDMSIFANVDKQMRDGEAWVKRPNGCDFWKDEPDAVYKLKQLDGQ